MASKNLALVPITDVSSVAVPKNLQERFALDVNRESALISGSSYWPYLSLQGGVFSFKGENLGDALDLVILGGVHENLYYDTEFVPGEPSAPACFALGTLDPDFEAADLVSHASAPDRQDVDACLTCWANAWKSGRRKGKACQNKKRIIAIHADDLVDPKSILNGQGFRISVPVTSVAPLGDFASGIHKGSKRPLSSIVTRVRLVPAGTTYKLAFEAAVAINDGDILDALVQKASQGDDSLLALPSTGGDRESEKKASQAGSRKKVAKKAPAKKPAAKKGGTRRRTSRSA